MEKRKLLIAVFLLSALFFQSQCLGDDAQGHFQRGHQLYLDWKADEAEEEFKKALEMDPTLSDAHYYLGSIYFKQERYKQAIEQCRKALEINPGDIKSLIILGLSLQNRELYEQSISAFKKAIDLDRCSAPVHSALGLVYCAKGDLDKAKKEYEILKNIDPELADSLLEKIKLKER